MLLNSVENKKEYYNLKTKQAVQFYVIYSTRKGAWRSSNLTLF